MIGTVIGSGIFLVPGGVLRQAGGHAGPALLVWVVGGVLSLLGALAYGELGAMNPAAGGLYVYLRDAFGPLTAFLYGWTFFLVIATGSAATLAVASTSYLQQFVTLGPIGQKLAAVGLLAIVAAINVAQHAPQRRRPELEHRDQGRRAADHERWCSSSGIARRRPRTRPSGRRRFTLVAPLRHGPRHDRRALGVRRLAVRDVLGRRSDRSAAHVSARDRRSGTASLVGIYLFANIGYLAALGPQGVAGSDRVAAEAVGAIVGPGAAKLIAAAILVSIFSATNGLTISAPRVYYAMARDGLFFRTLGEVHPRYGTPAVSIVAGTLWAIVLAVSGTFEQLLTYVVFVGWIFYALGAACVFVLRRTQPDADRPFRVPGYPWTPMLFIVAAAALVGNTIATQPVRAAVGIGVVLLGLPVYFIWRKPKSQPASV